MDVACAPHHDWFNMLLTGGLCLGLIVSYAPQHYRIISTKSSEGLSPLFLLLGSTSNAAGMWNMIVLQWGIAKCCRVVGLGNCVEMTMGIVQLTIQWACFSLIFVLYMMYYPSHLKYVTGADLTPTSATPLVLKAQKKTMAWRFSLLLAWITLAHLVFISLTSVILLSTATPSPAPNVPLPSHLHAWASFLGLTSALLAAIQYAPQLIHTYRQKLVGALSIPMMCIQTPGAVFMILSIALRPGTNWTTWATFLVAGIMQGSLLIMCLMWKLRQRKLGIDDFGNSLGIEECAPLLSNTDN